MGPGEAQLRSVSVAAALIADPNELKLFDPRIVNLTGSGYIYEPLGGSLWKQLSDANYLFLPPWIGEYLQSQETALSPPGRNI